MRPFIPRRAMKANFLQTVYDIISRDPRRPVDLTAVASELGITFERAEHISEQLHAARLIYRFPKRRLGAGLELVISRAGVARLKALRGDSAAGTIGETVSVPRVVAMRAEGAREYTDCRVRVDLDAKAVGVWRHRASGTPEETLPLEAVLIGWAPPPPEDVSERLPGR
jgi:hypothetical protein